MSDGEASMEKKNGSARPRSSRAQASAPNSSTSSNVLLSSASQSDQKAAKLGQSDSFRASNGGKNGRPLPVAQRKVSGPSTPRRAFPRVNFGSTGLRNQVARDNAEDRAELGSLSRPGSKKGGGRGFHRYDVHHDNYGNYRGRGGWDQYRFGRQRYTSTSTDFNKERFLQANCQFIVADAFDYSLSLADPDLLVEWDQIEEMRLLSDEILSCPICLYPPVAAKITRCGHIYCWSCILHYLALSDHQWRKCPICYESIYGKQLKSVVATCVEKLRVDGVLKMRLMKREKGTAIALPVGNWTEHHKELMRYGDECCRFAKLIKIGHTAVNETVIGRERRELNQQLTEQRDEPEAVFIHKALQLLEEREETVLKAATIRDVMSSPVLDSAERDVTGLAEVKISDQLPGTEEVTFFADAFDDVKCDETCAESRKSVEECISEPATVPVSVDSTLEASAPLAVFEDEKAMKTMVYFYQADDGQPVYINPINVRCLVQEYGSLSGAPALIEGKVLALESYVMTEETRQRFRYLAHLPLGTCFTLAELKLGREFLSRKTVAAFSEEFARRSQVRLKKERDDKRRADQAEKWDRACLMDPSKYPMSKLPSCPVPEIPVITYVASAQQDIRASFGQQAASISPPISENFLPDSDSPPLGGSPPESDMASPPSFAQMLKLGKPKPVLPKTESPSEASSSTVVKSPGDDEESMPAPAYQNTLGDALEAAFSSKGSVEEKKKKKKKKGKKGKATVLFSM